ncbi:hypothetical protein L1766_11460 [Thermovorax subterraneus]|nr:hypothetical protein [Thermovorax subterraneus]
MPRKEEKVYTYEDYLNWPDKERMHQKVSGAIYAQFFKLTNEGVEK